MYRKVKINHLEDYFVPLSSRMEKGVYFYRLNSYSQEVEKFLYKYLDSAKTCGIVISGKIQNPDGKQLDYYNEIMGLGFEMDKAFFDSALKKWLPRLSPGQRENVLNSLYNTLEKMRREGKNDNMLKNAYIKFMCWFYYRFERILSKLGQENVPKILYEGSVSSYELKMLGIIADAGCDIVLLQYAGDSAYLNQDPKSMESFPYVEADSKPFPQDFSIEKMQKEAESRARLAALYNSSRLRICATNIWLTGNILEDSLKRPSQRGGEDYIYNMFCQMTGVEDKAAYCGELFRWKVNIENSGRTVTVIEELPPPTPDEIARVNKNDYKNINQLLLDLTSKVSCTIDNDLESQAKKAFAEIINKENDIDGGNMNRVKNKAVYILCWFERYYKKLFNGYKKDSYNVFVYFGVCRNNFESLFLRFLARMPLDVIIINPDLTKESCLRDAMLFEKKFEASMKLDKFPVNPNDVKYGTAAYHAEQDLTQLMYQDSGLYRARQYKTATAVSLQTMYEEMYLLWDEEVKYRPNFETLENNVILPVIISKISGVKDGNTAEYWQEISKLLVDDTILIKKVPFLNGFESGITQFATLFLKNRKLQRQKIKSHPSYKYSIFREEIQEYMLDKLQELLDSGLIDGTYAGGVEYKIISVVLGLNKDIMRLIQKIDFTKKVPKLVFVCTGEESCSLDDSILIAFLHLIGFDIAMFVPTGYRIAEKYYTQQLFVEHQIGEYMYDLNIPDFKKIVETRRGDGIIGKIFKKGR